MGQKKRFDRERESAEDELEIDMDDDFEIADGEDIPEELLLSADRRKSSWRLIEQLREQRQLQMQLEDFDQYVV